MMRVLFVSPVVPWPPESGGRMRTWNLIRSLRGRAEVHLRAVLEPGQGEDALEPLRRTCSSALGFPRGAPGTVRRWTRARIERWFHSPDLEASLTRELASDGFDLVHLDEMLLARALPEDVRVPVVVHHHKLDTLLHEFLPARTSWHRRFDLWKLHRLESDAARLFHRHVVCSAEDARILAGRYPALQLGVVESGFDPDYFRPTEPPAPRVPDRLLFVGSMGYVPNVDAVLHFVHEVFPRVRTARPGAVLEVIGAEAPPEILALESDSVHVRGLVGDVRPYLASAAAFVAPIRIGGGTRLKLVEALAMGCPAVSTAVGAQGLEFADGRHLRIADDPPAFAAAVVALLADPIAAARMAEAGRARAQELYRWDDLAARLLALWQAAVDDGAVAGRSSAQA